MEEDKDKQGLSNTPSNLPVIKNEGGFSSPSSPPPSPPHLQGKKELPSSEIKSSIRTMESDLEAISKGKSPIDIYTKRESKVLPKDKAVELVPPPLAGKPESITTKPPIVKLGELKKTESFKISPSIGRISPPKPPAKKKSPPSKPTPGMITVPSQKSFFSRFLIPLLILVVVAGFSTWFFAIRSEPTPIVKESPTPLPPTSTPIPAEGKLVVNSTGDPLTQLSNFIEGLDLTTEEWKIFDVVDELGEDYDFLRFSQRFSIDPPQDIIQILGTGNLKLVVYKQIESFNGILPKRFGFIMEVNQSVDMAQLKNWESTLSFDMKDIFGLDLDNPQATEFQDNSHNDTAIRYRNFPAPDRTTDYAVISLEDKQYLAFVNSRETIYFVIDNISQIFPASNPSDSL